MKVAYLTSMYPDVSHTFIMREVFALRAHGIELGTFSVRRAREQNILGHEARQEAASTRWLVPPRVGHLVTTIIWAIATRPLRTGSMILRATMKRRMAMGQRLKWLFYSGEAILLAYWLVAEGFDHLHCHFGNSGSSTGMLAARLAGIPFSFTCHGSELYEISKHRLVEKTEQTAFVACVSKYGRAQLMQACAPQQWDKLCVVRCGVIQADVSSRTTKFDPPNILSVARLSPEKGHLVLLNALTMMRDAGVSFRCTLVGDGPMRSTLEAYVKKLELSEFVTFTGSLEPSAVADTYRIATVVVLASFTEGVPIVLMEAMTRGIPVVATRVGGVSELVMDGRNGVLVPPGDAMALSEALRLILDDPEWAQTIGLCGARDLRRDFNLDVSAARLAELFNGAYRHDVKDATKDISERNACRT